jgi:hypothetical protein
LEDMSLQIVLKAGKKKNEVCNWSEYREDLRFAVG